MNGVHLDRTPDSLTPLLAAPILVDHMRYATDSLVIT